jgi:eukaryotic-like serine/threonine-protein kinase
VDVLAGRYELAEPLGAGGMAHVTAAYDRLLDRRVAVKLIRDELVGDVASRERLLREARAAAGLHHPNTVAVFDVGEDGGRPFIVMELVEGETLADRLARVGALPPDEAVRIAGAVLEGLAAAHDRGLVHRDVKPSNILLPVAGGVKLADFGIAKELSALTTGLTATGSVLGTPRYLAPEQAAGGDAGPASDLYALGAVLYECLAGRAPFEGDNPLAVALAHQQEAVPSLVARAPGVPPALEVAVERALAKRPEDRHGDAREMHAALKRAPVDPAGGVRRPPPTPVATRQLAADAPSAPAGEPPSGGGAAPRRRWWVAAAVLVPLGLLGVVLTLADPGADGEVTEADAEADAVGGADPPAARDLGDLVSDLARDPAAAGERGDDLLAELLELRGESAPEDRREDARELIVEIGSWLEEGELDGETGEETLTLLEPEARPPGPELAEVTGLLVDVARDKEAWGERADDLLDDLEDLLDEDDREDRAEDAEKLVERIERWREQGRLDPDRSSRAVEVLRPVAG